jgi:hypothetical protein
MFVGVRAECGVSEVEIRSLEVRAGWCLFWH